MTPSDPVERITAYPVPIDLTEGQIEIVGDEMDSVLIGVTQDLAHLDGKPDPAAYVEEVAAYGRLAAALTSGILHLPDRRCLMALERLARELDHRNDYERVRAEHEAFGALVELMRTPRPSAAATRGRP
jgi:hypothetical protein